MGISHRMILGPTGYLFRETTCIIIMLYLYNRTDGFALKSDKKYPNVKKQKTALWRPLLGFPCKKIRLPIF